MPNWQPNWDDVEFDHAKAQAALDECHSAAGALTVVIGGLDGAHTQLGAGGAWTGAYRGDYDVEQPVLRADAVAARDALNALAGAIAGAMTSASTEQARREADRERWRAERDREQADRDRRLADQGYVRLPNGKLVPI